STAAGWSRSGRSPDADARALRPPPLDSWSRGGHAPGEAAFAGAGQGRNVAVAAPLASPASFLLGCVATFSPLTGSPMAQASDHRLLTSPRIFLVGMAAFLILVGFGALILYKQIL